MHRNNIQKGFIFKGQVCIVERVLWCALPQATLPWGVRYCFYFLGVWAKWVVAIRVDLTA